MRQFDPFNGDQEWGDKKNVQPDQSGGMGMVKRIAPFQASSPKELKVRVAKIIPEISSGEVTINYQGAQDEWQRQRYEYQYQTFKERYIYEIPQLKYEEAEYNPEIVEPAPERVSKEMDSIFHAFGSGRRKRLEGADLDSETDRDIIKQIEQYDPNMEYVRRVYAGIVMDPDLSYMGIMPPPMVKDIEAGMLSIRSICLEINKKFDTLFVVPDRPNEMKLAGEIALENCRAVIVKIETVVEYAMAQGWIESANPLSSMLSYILARFAYEHEGYL